MMMIKKIALAALALSMQLCVYAKGTDAVLTAILPHLNDWRSERQNELRSLPESSVDVPLFTAYPALRGKIPHVSLGIYPTPVRHLEKLGAVLSHPSIYMKDDSNNGMAFGGNKPRKLEFLLADALQHGAKRIITEGGAGSNHTTATITYARQLGMECSVFLAPQKITAYLRRNLLLSTDRGGTINATKDMATRQYSLLKDYVDHRLQTGEPSYYIPGGGSNEIGTLGYVNAAFELKEQIDAGLMPEPDYIFVAAGSNGTAAGLALGCLLAKLKTHVIAIKATSQAEGDMEYAMAGLVANTLSKLMVIIPDLYRGALSIPQVAHGYFDPGYAAITPETAAAIALARSTENIVLDGTYAGRAFAALTDWVRYQPDAAAGKVILFWNTFCSASHADETSTVDHRQLPTSLQHYFTDELQNGDQGLA